MLHTVAIEASFEATVEVEIPPLVRLTHHPERTEELSGTVTVERPGVSRWVSRTVLLTHDDGTTTEHEVSAHLTIPRRTVRADFTYDYLHAERVEAEVVDRPPTGAEQGRRRRTCRSACGPTRRSGPSTCPNPRRRSRPIRRR